MKDTSLQEYIASKRGKKVPSDIRERWQSRVVPRGLHTLGELGAAQYLSDYGKGIGAPKVVLLAICAESMGCPQMALGFWKKAYTLEGGTINNVLGSITTSENMAATAFSAPEIVVPGFPAGLQPGRFAPMQPSDAEHNRQYYIDSPRYWGQPKIDGKKLIVFATDRVYYQSRQMKLGDSPDLSLDYAMKEVAALYGPFVLEGEMTYLDAVHGEHRTGSQAATVNIELGFPMVQPRPSYMVFSCLYHSSGRVPDLRPCEYEARIHAAAEVIGKLAEYTHIVEMVWTARTQEQKERLCDEQRLGREGEVWFRHDMPYIAGKHSDDRFARTKYLTEFEAIVTGLTPTTVEGHAFGAISISNLQGRLLGQVGTGFTRKEKQEIKNRFESGQQVRINIKSQGFTETGAVFQGRFEGFADEQ